MRHPSHQQLPESPLHGTFHEFNGASIKSVNHITSVVMVMCGGIPAAKRRMWMCRAKQDVIGPTNTVDLESTSRRVATSIPPCRKGHTLQTRDSNMQTVHLDALFCYCMRLIEWPMIVAHYTVPSMMHRLHFSPAQALLPWTKASCHYPCACFSWSDVLLAIHPTLDPVYLLPLGEVLAVRVNQHHCAKLGPDLGDVKGL